MGYDNHKYLDIVQLYVSMICMLDYREVFFQILKVYYNGIRLQRNQPAYGNILSRRQDGHSDFYSPGGAIYDM